MQVPERLALIGGGILLSSTLVFTLKSQASTIIPNVSHSISGVFDHIGDAQKSSDFDSNFQQAQKNNQKTGTWGSSKYYIDNDNNLHIGAGQLQGRLQDILDSNTQSKIVSVDIDQPIQAPNNSSGLFAGSFVAPSRVVQFNGLSNLDTSNVTSMSGMFAHNGSLRSIDPAQINISKANDVSYIFGDDASLQHIDLSSWDMSKISNTSKMLQNQSSLSSITLGDKTHLNPISGLTGRDWQQGNDRRSSIGIQDSNIHPGTWYLQSSGS